MVSAGIVTVTERPHALMGLGAIVTAMGRPHAPMVSVAGEIAMAQTVAQMDSALFAATKSPNNSFERVVRE